MNISVTRQMAPSPVEITTLPAPDGRAESATPRVEQRAESVTVSDDSVAPTTALMPHADKDIPNYTGPTDGECHYNAKRAGYWRSANKLAVTLLARMTVRGAQNIPQSGPQILCFNHQSYIDPPVAMSVSDRDWRSMAAKEQFTGFIGKAMTDMGAIPVDRAAHSTKPVDVAKKELDAGNGLIIFPEGRIYEDGKLEEHVLQEGAAMIALHSKCESLIPAAIAYRDHPVGVGTRLLNYATAAAVVAGGVAAATGAGPVIRIGCGIMTGLLTGVVAGAATGFLCSNNEDGLRPKLRATGNGAGWGALAGAAVGGLGAAFLGLHGVYLAAPLSIVSGIATLAAARYMSAREDALVAIGKGIDVEPYRQMADKKAARARLTDDLHKAMMTLKQDIEKP